MKMVDYGYTPECVVERTATYYDKVSILERSRERKDALRDGSEIPYHKPEFEADGKKYADLSEYEFRCSCAPGPDGMALGHRTIDSLDLYVFTSVSSLRSEVSTLEDVFVKGKNLGPFNEPLLHQIDVRKDIISFAEMALKEEKLK